MKRMLTQLIAAAAIAMTMSGCYMTTVDSGEAGIPLIAGKVGTEVIKPGFAFNMHPMANLEKMNTKAKLLVMSRGKAGLEDTKEVMYAPPVGILTSENLKVPVDVSVLYNIKMQSALKVRTNYGIDTVWEEKIVINKARAVIREAIGKASVYDLNKNRSQYEQTIISVLQERLGEYVDIQQVNINDIPLPAKIQAAVDAKMVEAEAASAAVYALKRIEVEAQQVIAEKQGVADANKILTKSITPDLIVWKQLEIKEIEAKAWNGQLPSKLLMGADVPVIVGSK